MAKPVKCVDSSVPPSEWAKHLRPFGRKKMNGKARARVRAELAQKVKESARV